MSESPGTGVPAAVPRLLLLLQERVGAEAMDRLWIFPPLVRGRKEWGLIAASCYLGEVKRRRLVTAAYSAVQTGLGMEFDAEIVDEGVAPPDRMPRVMSGVVRRTRMGLGDPREVCIGGKLESLRGLLSEFDPEQLEAARVESRN